jgi:nucleotide-binding universal stress UspA family protein
MMFSNIVVGLDGSPPSRQALVAALNLAGPDTRLTVVSVEEDLPHYVAMRGEFDENKRAADEFFARLGREAVALAGQYGRTIEHRILVGHAALALVEYAREHKADLIVIGHSGHSGIWGTFLGTTADKIMRHAPCSVLVVRPPDEQPKSRSR